MLERLDRLSDAVASQVRKVCSRTFTEALWNRQTNDIHFYCNGDVSRGVWQQSVDRDRPWSDMTVDYIARMIWTSRNTSARQKDRMVTNAKTSEASDMAESRGRESEDRKKEYEQVLKSRRNRRGMGKHFKGSAVVRGVKEK